MIVMKIKKGDKVLVLSGKDRGKAGVVEQLLPKSGKARVAGMNVARKHNRRGGRRPAGIVEINQPLPLAKLKLLCPHCQKAARVGFRFSAQKVKERYCKRCGAAV